MSIDLPVLSSKDFASDQEIRWCPRCGDYSILAQMKKVLPTLGIPKEKFVFVSGIGCSSRFPYYMNTYGFHGIHGRAPAIATGLKVCRPDLQVWVITGDGDSLSIGGNHLMHAIRRNVGLKIVLFNNQIYGLTKGQYSPTSPLGKKTKSTPLGSIDHPLSPLSVAIGTEATFVARSVDVDIQHLTMVLERAAHHEGTAFVEVYQDCNVFNSGAFLYASKKGVKEDNTVYLEHGKPLIFGKNRDKGIRVNEGSRPEIVELGNGISEDDLLFHDEKAPEPSLAFMLARMRHPEFPEPLGVFRDVSRPTYDGALNQQVQDAIEIGGTGDLEKLFHSGETWTVSASGREVVEPRTPSGNGSAASGNGSTSTHDSDTGEEEHVELCEASGEPLQAMTEPGELEQSITRHAIDVLNPRPAVIIQASTSVRDAVAELVNRKIGCLLVEEDGKLAGIFTERDILNKLSSDLAQLDRPVSEFMTKAPETISKIDSIAYALHKMDIGGYRHQPIVDEQGRAVGIISIRDILRFLCVRFGHVRSQAARS